MVEVRLVPDGAPGSAPLTVLVNNDDGTYGATVVVEDPNGAQNGEGRVTVTYKLADKDAETVDLNLKKVGDEKHIAAGLFEWYKKMADVKARIGELRKIYPVLCPMLQYEAIKEDKIIALSADARTTATVQWAREHEVQKAIKYYAESSFSVPATCPYAIEVAWVDDRQHVVLGRRYKKVAFLAIMLDLGVLKWHETNLENQRTLRLVMRCVDASNRVVGDAICFGELRVVRTDQFITTFVGDNSLSTTWNTPTDAYWAQVQAVLAAYTKGYTAQFRVLQLCPRWLPEAVRSVTSAKFTNHETQKFTGTDKEVFYWPYALLDGDDKALHARTMQAIHTWMKHNRVDPYKVFRTTAEVLNYVKQGMFEGGRNDYLIACVANVPGVSGDVVLAWVRVAQLLDIPDTLKPATIPLKVDVFEASRRIKDSADGGTRAWGELPGFFARREQGDRSYDDIKGAFECADQLHKLVQTSEAATLVPMLDALYNQVAPVPVDRRVLKDWEAFTEMVANEAKTKPRDSRSSLQPSDVVKCEYVGEVLRQYAWATCLSVTTPSHERAEQLPTEAKMVYDAVEIDGGRVFFKWRTVDAKQGKGKDACNMKAVRVVADSWHYQPTFGDSKYCDYHQPMFEYLRSIEAWPLHGQNIFKLIHKVAMDVARFTWRTTKQTATVGACLSTIEANVDVAAAVLHDMWDHIDPERIAEHVTKQDMDDVVEIVRQLRGRLNVIWPKLLRVLPSKYQSMAWDDWSIADAICETDKPDFTFSGYTSDSKERMDSCLTKVELRIPRAPVEPNEPVHLRPTLEVKTIDIERLGNEHREHGKRLFLQPVDAQRVIGWSLDDVLAYRRAFFERAVVLRDTMYMEEQHAALTEKRIREVYANPVLERLLKSDAMSDSDIEQYYKQLHANDVTINKSGKRVAMSGDPISDDIKNAAAAVADLSQMPPGHRFRMFGIVKGAECTFSVLDPRSKTLDALALAVMLLAHYVVFNDKHGLRDETAERVRSVYEEALLKCGQEHYMSICSIHKAALCGNLSSWNLGPLLECVRQVLKERYSGVTQRLDGAPSSVAMLVAMTTALGMNALICVLPRTGLGIGGVRITDPTNGVRLHVNKGQPGPCAVFAVTSAWTASLCYLDRELSETYALSGNGVVDDPKYIWYAPYLGCLNVDAYTIGRTWFVDNDKIVSVPPVRAAPARTPAGSVTNGPAHPAAPMTDTELEQLLANVKLEGDPEDVDEAYWDSLAERAAQMISPKTVT